MHQNSDTESSSLYLLPEILCILFTLTSSFASDWKKDQTSWTCLSVARMKQKYMVLCNDCYCACLEILSYSSATFSRLMKVSLNVGFKLRIERDVVHTWKKHFASDDIKISKLIPWVTEGANERFSPKNWVPNVSKSLKYICEASLVKLPASFSSKVQVINLFLYWLICLL